MYGPIIGWVAGLQFSTIEPPEEDFPLLDPEHPDNTIPSHCLWPAVPVAVVFNEIYGTVPECDLDAEIYKRSKDLSLDWSSSKHIEDDLLGLAWFYCYASELSPKHSDCAADNAMILGSVAGWISDDMETTRIAARRIARVFAKHTDELKFAEVIASAVFLARTGETKDTIRNYLYDNFPFCFMASELTSKRRYLNKELVVEAVSCFLRSCNFEDALRLSEYSGGTNGSRTALVGAIAEAYYGIPEELIGLFGEYLIQTPWQNKCAKALDKLRRPRQPRHGTGEKK